MTNEVGGVAIGSWCRRLWLDSGVLSQCWRRRVGQPHFQPGKFQADAGEGVKFGGAPRVWFSHGADVGWVESLIEADQVFRSGFVGVQALKNDDLGGVPTSMQQVLCLLKFDRDSRKRQQNRC